ncbi:MAG: response regulator [Bacillota bacterium]|nr:response regulator [Bacillota bacterium]
MLTVAVIDDEWLSAECLVDMLKSYHQPFKTLSFTDAELALKLFEENRPDILFVDIKMPRMSGFELIDQVTDTINPDIVPVIVSGYQDIQYYQHAIQREVIDYILKPVKAGDLSVTLDRAIDRCNKISCEKKHADCFIQHEKRKIFDQLAETGSLNLDIIDPSLHSAVTSFLKMIEQSSCQIVSVMADNVAIEPHWHLIQDMLSQSCKRLEAFRKDTSQIDFIMAEPFNLIQMDSVNLLDCQRLSKLRIGISTATTRLSQLPEKAAEALISCNFGIYTGLTVNTYVEPQEIVSYYSASTQYEYQLTAVKEACLLSGGNLVPLVTRLFDTQQYHSYWDYRHHIEQVLLTFSLMIKNHSLPVDPLDLDKLLTTSFTREHLVEKVILWLVGIAKALEESRKPDSKSNLLQTIEYIDHNFTRDISLDFLANMAKVGRSYYCALFKQHCGKTLVEYITDKRIQYACHLLREGRMKVNEVSGMCGYPDHYYFYKIFKRQTGMTPGEYVKNINAGQPEKFLS